MNRKTALITAALLLVMAAASVLLLVRRPVVISVDGEHRQVHSTALTAGGVLRAAGIALSRADRVTPPLNQWLGADAVIEVTTARPVTIWDNDQDAGDTYLSTERTPLGMLASGGREISEGDVVMLNGLPVEADQVLPPQPAYLLQLRPAKDFSIILEGKETAFSSPEESIGAALWKEGIRLSYVDGLSVDFTAPVGDNLVASLQRAKTIRIALDGKQITARSAGSTVGQVLADAGIPLQGLDYSRPSEDQPVAPDGIIEVVRVQEIVELRQTAIPFTNDLIADAELELDQRRIIQAGQEGIRVSRELVRIENGIEVSRTNEAEWTAAEPVNQISGYGTKIVIRTMDTPDGPIEYWRSARVYATSYAPCNFLLTIGRCSYTTANGSRLQKGVIGTGEAWYRLMVNQGVYVEGYGAGIIGDWGYVGGYWVDLGYSDADFINWHRYTTLYWLTPVPANIPWILPP